VLTQPPPRRRFGAPLIAALVIVMVAAGFLVWSVVDLTSAGSDVDDARQAVATANKHLKDLRADGAVEVTTARDEALDAASKGAVVMNTLDYRKVDAGMDAWERVTTGDLHDEVVNGREQSTKAITDARSVTEAKLLSAAVEDVNERAGTATVLVSVKVNVTVGSAAPTDRYMRLKCTAQRTGQGWKLDGLGQVAVQP
jgi:Mce-associated membrane protein